jgi:malonyl-CoA/methylmalonyl-CoA synthetase
MANTFLDMDIKKGDRVIILLTNSLFFVTAHMAIQKIGAIGVPLNPGSKQMEMSYFINDLDAKLLISGPEHKAMIMEIPSRLTNLVVDTQKRYEELNFFRSVSNAMPKVDIRANDPGLIIYTSGTTGRPKGAILTQKNLVHDLKNVIKVWQITESDVLCHALPLFHVHGLCFALHTALLAGSHILLLDQFSPEAVTKILRGEKGRYDCTMFMAVPSMYSKLIEYVGGRRMGFETVRLWTSGSAPLPPKDFHMIKGVFGKEPVEREGMSETGMNFSNPLKGVRKPGSVGLPLPGLAVRIVDPSTFKDVDIGQTGEIWLKGPGVTHGYWRKPDETARSFEKGWFRTGDLGRVDEDGYYYLTDRIKHIIISGGENISSKEIEGVINRLAGVIESSVVGIPDEKWGERVAAAVVTKPGFGINQDKICSHCREHLHDWKCPKEVVFLDQLPRNTMGKVLKDQIKKYFGGRP